MGEKVVVIIAAHKRYRMPTDGMYLPVQVGAAGKPELGYQRDNEGENISELNPLFCELTGLYWAWKNLDADYIGLAHYRRYFSRNRRSRDPWRAVLRYEDIAGELDRVRVFVPKKRRYWIETLYSHYAHTHYASQLDETRRIIAERCPDYLAAYDRVVKRRWGYMFNMMILRRELLDAYCEWLFGILFELREGVGKQAERELDGYQGRFYGRISEIIFNVWLEAQLQSGAVKPGELRELPVVHMEKINWWKKGTAFLRAKFGRKKYSGSF